MEKPLADRGKLWNNNELQDNSAPKENKGVSETRL